VPTGEIQACGFPPFTRQFSLTHDPSNPELWTRVAFFTMSHIFPYPSAASVSRPPAGKRPLREVPTQRLILQSHSRSRNLTLRTECGAYGRGSTYPCASLRCHFRVITSRSVSPSGFNRCRPLSKRQPRYCVERAQHRRDPIVPLFGVLRFPLISSDGLMPLKIGNR